MKKFELTSEFITNEFGEKLYRIKALISFGNVKEGKLGGFVEKEDNLSQAGNAWVADNARVAGNARVADNARVAGNARVSGNAWVADNARVSGNAWVADNARVAGNARVAEDARVYGNAWVSGNARVYGNAWVAGNACVSGNARVSGNAWVAGNACVSGNARVADDADYAVVAGFGRDFRATTFFRCKDKTIRVQCGCFYGDLAQFREIVKKTHDDSKYAKEYLAIADLMELHFSDSDAKQEAAK